MPVARSTSPRSLADDLRGRDDDDLRRLLAARPDLATPLPADLTQLAGRATTRASVQRALERLDAGVLQVAEVLAALPEPTTPAAVRRAWGPDPRAQLTVLREQALVWGGERSLRLVRAARDALGPHPAGLGPPLHDALDRRSPARLAALLADLGLPPTGDAGEALDRAAAHLALPEVVTALLDRAPDGARQVLDRLTWGPPVGAVAQADRAVRATSAGTPVEWLLAHGLLAVLDPGHVVLPREVALALRGGRVHAEPVPQPPPLEVTQRPPKVVDATAAGAAAEAVRLVEELGRSWGLAPPSLLRAGGLGVRDLKRTAATLEVDEPTAARVAELAYAAGLVADDGQADPRWAPTPAFDTWAEQGTGARWAVLAETWLRTTRAPALVGTRDDRGTPRAALAPDLDRPSGPLVRAAALAESTACEPGEAPSEESLRARLRWRAPRRWGRVREQLTGWALAEAAWLGLTGRGALSSAGRALLEGAPTRAAAAVDAALPAPVDAVLLQADLTAVAPGPPVPALARLLALVADVESRGGATVYRFTPGSVRRGLDAGQSADDLLAELRRASRTEVPQPLEYLVRDVARRHGRVRVGAASAYLRSDDPSVLEEVLAERRTAVLRLRRLAPGVLAAQAGPQQVLEVLRSIGLAPAAETPDGDLLVRRPDERRTPPRRPPRPVVVEPPAPGTAALASAVQALRAGDGAREAAPPLDGPALPATDPATALVLLREAAARRERVWIGYVEGDGRPVRRLVRPLRVDGGRVTAVDGADGSDETTYSVHRVTGVAPGGR